MVAVTSTSWTGATVVCTWTIKCGQAAASACSPSSSAPVSVRCTDVTQPGHLPLFACLGLDIIGRTNDPLLAPGLRTCSPSGLASRKLVILLPDLSQHLDTA